MADPAVSTIPSKSKGTRGRTKVRAITADYLRQIISYDPVTGVFTWKARMSNRQKQGAAGCLCKKSGYRLIGIHGRVYKASRLAWLYMTGEWPGQYVDHRNLDRADDRWENLRGASPAENQHNQTKPKNNRSGFKGVSRYSASGGKWCARVTAHGKTYRENSFDTAEEAAAWYAETAKRVHGEFART